MDNGNDAGDERRPRSMRLQTDEVVIRLKRQNEGLLGNDEEDVDVNVEYAEEDEDVNIEDFEEALDEDSNVDSTEFVVDCGELSHSIECGICPQSFKNEGEVEKHRRNHKSDGAHANRNHQQNRSGTREGQNFQDNVGGSRNINSNRVLLNRCTICNVTFPQDQVHEHFESEMHRNEKLAYRRLRRK